MLSDHKYSSYAGPAFDEDCQCHCMEERNTFQAALDAIADRIKGQRISDLTDIDLEFIDEQVSDR